MHVTLILWSSAILVTAAITRGSILPALMSAMPSGSKVTFLFLSSSAPSGESVPPCPSWPNCEGSTAWCLAPPPAAGRRGRPRSCPSAAGCGVDRRRPAGAGGSGRRGGGIARRRPAAAAGAARRGRRRARGLRVADVDGRLRHALLVREVGRAREVLRVLLDRRRRLLRLLGRLGLRRLLLGDLLGRRAPRRLRLRDGGIGRGRRVGAALGVCRGRRVARGGGRVAGAARGSAAAAGRRPARRRCRLRRSGPRRRSRRPRWPRRRRPARAADGAGGADRRRRGRRWPAG